MPPLEDVLKTSIRSSLLLAVPFLDFVLVLMMEPKASYGLDKFSISNFILRSLSLFFYFEIESCYVAQASLELNGWSTQALNL